MNEFFYNFLFPFLASTSAVFVIISFYARRVLQYKETKEKSMRRMTCIARSRPVVLAMQFSRLHTAGQMYLLSKGGQREKLRIRMLDYVTDALRHLEDAIREGDGFEEGLFIDVMLDSAIEFDVLLRAVQDKVQGSERNFLAHILDVSSRCLQILRENGIELVNRFDAQWKEITEESNEN